MIALWMLYSLGISLLLALSALVLEHGLRLRGLSLRWVWMGALLGSVALTAAPWLALPAARNAGAATTATGAAVGTALVPSGPLGLPIRISSQDLSVLPPLTTLDQPLLLMWGLLSGAVVVFLWGAQRHLDRRRRVWRWTTLNRVPVLVSREVGPAVVGILDAAIVLPAWVLELDPPRRRLVIAHEREHVRARDTTLLALGALTLALLPWNIPIWWQMRRMRGAIELDCDARVLRGGHDVGRYAALLVETGVRRSAPSLAFAALAESKPLLERRIRTMLTPRPRHSNPVLAVSSVLALALLVLACEAPQPILAPVAPQAPAQDVQPGPSEVDDRIAINRIAANSVRDANVDHILLEVKPGPSFLLNGLVVPIADLDSVIAVVYGARPHKILWVAADPEVSDRTLAGAVEAARDGLGDALDLATVHGGRPNDHAAINVISAPLR